jgi:hypothetical protein
MDSSLDESRIETYLAAVDSSMGKVPKDRREALLLELREHVDKLVEDYEAAGRPRADAVDGALSMMGAARKVGRQYASMWYRSTEPGGVLLALGVITVVSTAIWQVLLPLTGRFFRSEFSDFSPLVALAPMMIARLFGVGIFVGWFSPKGAIPAAIIWVVLSVLSFLAVLSAHPLWDRSATSMQWYQISAQAATVGVAAATIRLRMRKFAGI